MISLKTNLKAEILMKLKKLTPEEKKIMIDKETEPPFTGKYENFFDEGTYFCRQCGEPLYPSESKFHSGGE